MAVDYFLKIDGIEGESQDDKHKNEIDVLSWSFGESNRGTFGMGGGGGAGKVEMQDFNFTMRVNKASPKLFVACATGQHFKKAVLTCRKAGDKQQEFMTITMTDCMISSYQSGAAGGTESIPIEQISLNFTKMEYEYREQKPDGTLGGAIKSGYDIAANKKI